MDDQQLDRLFSKAANQAPEASFEETRKAFEAAAVVGGGFLFARWVAQLFTKKGLIIMFSSITIIAASAVVLFNAGNPIPENEAALVPLHGTVEEAIAPTPNNAVSATLSPITAETLSVDGVMEIEITNDPETAEVEITNVVAKPITVVDTNTVLDAQPDAAAAPTVQPVPTSRITQTSNSVPQKNAAPDSVAHTNVVYVVTNNTTFTEFGEIADEAKKVGITFKYTLRVRKNYIKKLDLRMHFGNEQQKSRKQVTVNGKFEITVGWTMDADGQLVGFYDKPDEEED